MFCFFLLNLTFFLVSCIVIIFWIYDETRVFKNFSLNSTLNVSLTVILFIFFFLNWIGATLVYRCWSNFQKKIYFNWNYISFALFFSIILIIFLNFYFLFISTAMELKVWNFYYWILLVSVNLLNFLFALILFFAIFLLFKKNKISEKYITEINAQNFQLADYEDLNNTTSFDYSPTDSGNSLNSINNNIK